MNPVGVISKDGIVLMPTFNPKKVRRMLKDGRASIYSYAPFTIQLQYETTNETQDIEVSIDAGAEHIGISVKSEKHEFLHMQADMLPDEKQKHDERRKYRRTRRNRKRYRKPRFNNRRRKDGWFVPSVQHKIDCHISLFQKCLAVFPITEATVEVATFDTQMMEAMESGKPIPSGKDYQQGPRYQLETLRAAVFARDNYTCQCCGAKNVPLHAHHAYFWKNDHTNRLGGLMAICNECHTHANHKPDGKLWGLCVQSSSKAGAAFMNTSRRAIVNGMKKFGLPVNITYGAMTKLERRNCGLEKTHANDAYCIGKFRPKHRCHETHIKKQRRNNRILELFYDAVYIDKRDETQKSGAQLSCGRTNRSEPRNGAKNLRIYRGDKIRKGQRRIRKKRYEIRPHDTVQYKHKKYEVRGIHCKGTRVLLYTEKEADVSHLTPLQDKDGNLIPIQAGQKLALNDRKEKNLVLSISEDGTKATLSWKFSVKLEDIKMAKCASGGWINA